MFSEYIIGVVISFIVAVIISEYSDKTYDDNTVLIGSIITGILWPFVLLFGCVKLCASIVKLIKQMLFL